MEEILRQASRARRRLVSQVFLRELSRSSLIAFSVALVGIAIPKLWYLPFGQEVWVTSWMGGAAGVALLYAIFMAWSKRPNTEQSAAEIDRRFGLKERLGSVLFLNPEERSSPAGMALLKDALQKAERLDVRDAFPVGFHRGMAWSLIPMLLGLCGFILPNAQPGEEVVAREKSKVEVSQVRNSTQPLVEQLKKKREEAEKAGDMEAADMFKQLEDKLDKIRSDEKLDAKQAMAKLNDIKKEIEERKKELGSGENLKKNLQQNLKQIDQGPAEKMSKALQDGDLQKAEDELQKMMDKMSSGQMSAAEQKQLAKQLDSMQQALQESLEKHEQAKQMLEKELQQAEKSGDVQKAAQLRKQLGDLQAMDDQMAQLGDMQQQMQDLKNALESGDTKAAQEAMQKMMSKLEEMQGEMDSLQDLDELMDQLSDSKSSMAKKMGRMKGNMPGDGLGEGQGFGDRPEEETDTSTFDSQVRDQMRAGETVMKGKVSGANRKGQTKEEVKQAILTSTVEEAEALDTVVLPKSHRDQSRDYFDKMRGDKGSR